MIRSLTPDNPVYIIFSYLDEENTWMFTLFCSQTMHFWHRYDSILPLFMKQSKAASILVQFYHFIFPSQIESDFPHPIITPSLLFALWEQCLRYGCNSKISSTLSQLPLQWEPEACKSIRKMSTTQR